MSSTSMTPGETTKIIASQVMHKNVCGLIGSKTEKWLDGHTRQWATQVQYRIPRDLSEVPHTRQLINALKHHGYTGKKGAGLDRLRKDIESQMAAPLAEADFIDDGYSPEEAKQKASKKKKATKPTVSKKKKKKEIDKAKMAEAPEAQDAVQGEGLATKLEEQPETTQPTDGEETETGTEGTKTLADLAYGPHVTYTVMEAAAALAKIHKMPVMVGSSVALPPAEDTSPAE